MLSEKYGCIADNVLDLLGFVNVRCEWDQSKEDDILKPYLVGGGTLDGEESEEDEEEAAEEVEGVEEEVGKPPFLNVPACSAASPRCLHAFATAAASIHTPFTYNGTSIEVLNEHAPAVPAPRPPRCLQAKSRTTRASKLPRFPTFPCARDRSKSLSVNRPPSATSSHGTSASHSTSTSSASGSVRNGYAKSSARHCPQSLSHVGNSASALASSTSAKSTSTTTKNSHSKSVSHKSKLEATPSNCAKPAASLRGCLSPPFPNGCTHWRPTPAT
ncbi:hypothetical protein B0H14DRAFT_3460986 [Mycena olivaceomarginata]|nr:hypothetical protein B0H14DRAFT_3460986 [Mycena olivaceomarginata]